VALGNLVSPFAFLGPGYDKELMAIWDSPRQQRTGRQATSGVAGRRQCVAGHATARRFDHTLRQSPFAQRNCRENRKGRLLLIGTTNLDAQRPWSGTWARSRLALVPGLSALQKSHVSFRLDPCRICAGADRGQCCRQGL
jgi:hypothetical protein